MQMAQTLHLSKVLGDESPKWSGQAVSELYRAYLLRTLVDEPNLLKQRKTFMALPRCS